MEKAISIRCAGADNFDIEDLHPFQDDIKTMTPSTLKKLENVILSQGFSEPIAVWQNDGRNWILNGHQRHTALQSLRSRGWFVPPVPVAIVEAADEDEARKKVITLASQFGDFNQDHLLEFVAKAKLDNDWLKNNARLAAGDFKWPVLVTPTDEDETPPLAATPIVKRGEVYILGDHRLMCGDSTIDSDVSLLLKDFQPSFIFTDPPYGMSLDTNYQSMGKSGINHRPVIGDNDDFKRELIDCIFKFPSAREIFIFGADYFAELLPNKNQGSWVCWDKRSKSDEQIGILDGAFGSDFELCWSATKHKRKMVRILRETGAFSSRGDDASKHPTQKPIGLVQWFFDFAGKPNDAVLDLFAGSGSTLIACEKTKRRGFMMEIDPLYCGVILDRWQEFTGKVAHRDDGEIWDSIKNVRTD